jgi:hypothetical protein
MMTRALHLNGRPQGEESSVFPASTVRRMLDRYSVRMSMALTRLRDHRHGIERAGFLLPDLSPELLEALEPTDDFDGLVRQTHFVIFGGDHIVGRGLGAVA